MGALRIGPNERSGVLFFQYERKSSFSPRVLRRRLIANHFVSHFMVAKPEWFHGKILARVSIVLFPLDSHG